MVAWLTPPRKRPPPGSAMSTTNVVNRPDQLACALDASDAQNLSRRAVGRAHVRVYTGQLAIERCTLAEFGAALGAVDALRAPAARPPWHPAPECWSDALPQGRGVTAAT